MSSWTDERIEKLKNLWSEGLSASQIAGRLGGVTRNAVIGKVHRLGLQLNDAPHKHHPRMTTTQRSASRRGVVPKPKSASKKRPSKTAAIEGPIFVPDTELVVTTPHDVPRKSLQDLGDRDCKWPVGDPHGHDFGFCGQRQVPGRPYCDHHMTRAFRAPTPAAKPKTPATAATVQASNPQSVKSKEFQTAD
jgi:GcrA cell cycle regulator